MMIKILIFLIIVLIVSDIYFMWDRYRFINKLLKKNIEILEDFKKITKSLQHTNKESALLVKEWKKK